MTHRAPLLYRLVIGSMIVAVIVAGALMLATGAPVTGAGFLAVGLIGLHSEGVTQ
jgi:hypothetical protein